MLRKNRSRNAGIIAGVIYGLVIRLLMEFEGNDFMETMTIGFLFVTPAVMGAITVYFGTEEQRRSASFLLMMPWVSIASFLVLTMIAYLEATVCVVMLLPAFLLSASIGGVAMGYIMKKKGRSKTLSLILFLPFVVNSVESRFDNPRETSRVTTEIIIKANRETVWKNIKSVDTIRDKELKWSFAHFIGLPKPIRSEFVMCDKGNSNELPATIYVISLIAGRFLSSKAYFLFRMTKHYNHCW